MGPSPETLDLLGLRKDVEDTMRVMSVIRWMLYLPGVMIAAMVFAGLWVGVIAAIAWLVFSWLT